MFYLTADVNVGAPRNFRLTKTRQKQARNRSFGFALTGNWREEHQPLLTLSCQALRRSVNVAGPAPSSSIVHILTGVPVAVGLSDLT